MNITCEISSNESNSLNSSACDNTEDDQVFKIDVVLTILTVLLSFPTNSYVIWLIVTGTGNGLAAEFFILNFSICEIFYGIESVLIPLCYKFERLWGAVNFMEGFPMTGHPLFECLISIDRYLAVVHPVIFLKYKPLRYRLVCSVIAWVTSLCSCILNFMRWFYLTFGFYLIFDLVQFFVFLSIQLFCCLAVLRALKQSGPVERGKEREENHMKRRAFKLLLTTTMTTVIIHAQQITLLLLGWSSEDDVVLIHISYIFFLFTGLVQPLLFLYRVGKLNFIKGMFMFTVIHFNCNV